ncbi:MAG: sugar-binding domain-containing protein, partial [Spirochaetales bacterium]|nr:sugar-binding domain-containing protein [Spirochaetales bacterium]
MTGNYDRMVILRIAKQYYLDGLSQQEISEGENIHRTQISRILKQAREEGYIQIRIALPESAVSSSMDTVLKERLELDEVIVSPPLSAGEDQSESFTFFAARRIEEILRYSRNVGIGLGKTLYEVSSQIAAQRGDEGPNFFSIVGSCGTDNPYLQASILLQNFARPFSGKCRYNNLPILTSRKRMTSLENQRLEKLQEAYGSLDTVILSVGGLLNLDYPYLEEFSLFGKEVDTSRFLSRPHGNLLGHVFFDNGEILKLPGDIINTGMDLEQLKTVPRVICLARGERKADAIISAARQGYIKTLIT